MESNVLKYRYQKSEHLGQFTQKNCPKLNLYQLSFQKLNVGLRCENLNEIFILINIEKYYVIVFSLNSF